jgi:hypothetical protein
MLTYCFDRNHCSIFCLMPLNCWSKFDQPYFEYGAMSDFFANRAAFLLSERSAEQVSISSELCILDKYDLHDFILSPVLMIEIRTVK